MKSFTLLTLLISLNSFAVNTMTCLDQTNPDLKYVLKELEFETYAFTIVKTSEDPNSCRSRWGCEGLEKVIYEDTLSFEDFQGAGLYSSKRTDLTIDDPENASLSYVTKNSRGRFVRKYATLRCE